MEDLVRIEIITSKLKEFWMVKQERKLRFWQIIYLLENAMCDKVGEIDLWDVDDSEWIQVIDNLIKTRWSTVDKS